MAMQELASLKGPKGDGYKNPRIMGDDLVMDAVRFGLVAPEVVGSVRGPQGLAGVNALPGDAAVADWISTAGASATKAALQMAVEDIRQGIVVEQMPGATDSDRWDAALARANSTGKRLIYATRPTYTLSRPIDVGGLNGLTVQGVGKDQIKFRSGTTEIVSVFTATSNVKNIDLRGFTVEGTAVDDVTAPRRSRTYGPGGFRHAFNFYGDLVPGSSSASPAWPRVENITIDSVHVYGTKNLPAFLTGIRGKASITNSSFENNYDIGFTFCESVHFINNRVTKSADNGVSLSRGNKNVVCVGNSFELCAYWAIWIGGFRASPHTGFTIPSTPGPERVVISGNVGYDLGFGGVSAQSGPKMFNISGNVFEKLRYSPTDQTENYGFGVYITSHENDQPTTPTSYADTFSINGNLIVDAARGGVFLPFGVRNGAITGNVFVRMGSANKSDGTAALATEVGSNFGVYGHTAWNSTVSNIAVLDNVFIDDRSPVLMNYPVWSGNNSSWQVKGNVVMGGSRQPLRENPKLSISGAAGTQRALALQTDQQDRFAFTLDTSTETGSDAGSTMQAVVYGDSGTAKPAFVITRSNAVTRFVQPPRVPTMNTASRPTAFAAGSGAVLFDTSLQKLIVSNGSEWRDMNGAIV